MVSVTEHYTVTIVIQCYGDLKQTPMIDINWNPYRDGADKPQRTEALFKIEEFGDRSRFFTKHTALSMSSEITFNYKRKNKLQLWWNDSPKLKRDESFFNSHRG